MNITGKYVRVNWGGVWFDKGDILVGAEEGASVFGSDGDGADAQGDYWAYREDGMLVCLGKADKFEVLDN